MLASASEKDGGVTDVTVKFDEEAIDQYVDKKLDENTMIQMTSQITIQVVAK